MVIGVLAIQGAFAEHIECFRKLGCEVMEVRCIDDLHKVDALVIPGGETTTMRIIANMEEANGVTFMDELKRFVKQKPVWGTCAGCILLADKISNDSQTNCTYGTIGGVPMSVERNYFGRQNQSFSAPLKDSPWSDFNALFIRSPVILRVSKDVNVLGTISHPKSEEPIIVAASYRNFFATCFHPELTEDLRIHRYFVDTFCKNNMR